MRSLERALCFRLKAGRATALIIIYKNLNKKEQVNLKLKYMALKSS